VNKKVLSDLGDYLLAHREEIVGEWLRAVEQDSDISSSHSGFLIRVIHDR
jgi:hypothetical protein